MSALWRVVAVPSRGESPANTGGEGDRLDTELTEHDEVPGPAMSLNLVFIDAEVTLLGYW